MFSGSTVFALALCYSTCIAAKSATLSVPCFQLGDWALENEPQLVPPLVASPGESICPHGRCRSPVDAAGTAVFEERDGDDFHPWVHGMCGEDGPRPTACGGTRQ